MSSNPSETFERILNAKILVHMHGHNLTVNFGQFMCQNVRYFANPSHMSSSIFIFS